MTRTRRIWYKECRRFRYVEKRYVSDKKHVSCIQRRRRIRRSLWHRVRSQNRCAMAHGLYDYIRTHSNQLRMSEYFD